MWPKISEFSKTKKKNKPARDFSLTDRSKMAAEGNAEGIQGPSLLAFWELGRGGGGYCSLEELLENLSSLFEISRFLSVNYRLRNSGMTSRWGERHICHNANAIE